MGSPRFQTNWASPHEVKLVEAVLDSHFVGPRPKRLGGDKAYDSDALDRLLRLEQGVEFSAPHRANWKAKTQDGRVMQRHRRRWRVERLFVRCRYSASRSCAGPAAAAAPGRDVPSSCRDRPPRPIPR